MQQRNARIGLWFFGLYLAFYGAFVALAAFWPESMEVVPAAGVNLAIWYGFALIIVAFVLAMIYGWVCHNPKSSNDAGAQ